MSKTNQHSVWLRGEGYICKICIFELLSHRGREDKRYYSVACPACKSTKEEDYQPK